MLCTPHAKHSLLPGTSGAAAHRTISLTEGQLRALDALAGYGADAFFRAFYIKLGRAYMQPFERDLRELFVQIRKDVPTALEGVKAARAQLGLK